MFARTKRLTLRPAWPEDAAALATAIGHEAVTRMLTRVPYPYAKGDAERWIAMPRAGHDPTFLIVADEPGGPRLVGGIGIDDHEGSPHLGYWLTPSAWGRGYATEAGHAVLAMARHALPFRRLTAWHFVDNPASGQVLRKLGFRPTGANGPKVSAARAEPAASLEYEIDLAERDSRLQLAA